MTRSRRIAGIAISATLLATAVVATTATVATAHTPAAAATCSTLAVDLQSYSPSEAAPQPNSVTVTIDTEVTVTEPFGASFTREFEFGDASTAHSWVVEIDAVDDAYDRDLSGTSTPCGEAVLRDSVATVSTTPSSCTEPSTLVLGTITNASWSTPTLTTGPGDYSVTATADTGHQFDDGSASWVFTGTLPSLRDATLEECQPDESSVVVPPKPEPTDVSSQSVADDCGTTTRSITTTRTTTGWVLNPAGNAWVPAAPVVTLSTVTETIGAQVCPEVGSTDDPPATTDPPLDPADAEEPTVGSIFYYAPSSLAHNGTDSVLPIAIALAMLLAGVGIHLLRTRIRTHSH